MSFVSWIRKLERKGIVSRKPHSVVPFLLVVFEVMLVLIVRTGGARWLEVYLYYLIGFTLVFAVVHLIVVRIVGKGKNK
jgi:hypothetical protein